MCGEKKKEKKVVIGNLLKGLRIAIVSIQTSIAIMALSPVTATETCSKTE